MRRKPKSTAPFSASPTHSVGHQPIQCVTNPFSPTLTTSIVAEQFTPCFDSIITVGNLC